MGMLVSFAPVEMAIDGGVGVFPNLEKRIGRVLILSQRNVIVVQNAPRIARVKGWWFSLGKENVGLERILEEAVNSSADLDTLRLVF
jgi:hypothetical protein